MTALETVGIFYVLLGTGVFTAAWVIAAAYVLAGKISQLRELIAIGKRVKAEEEELRRIAK